MVRVANPAVSRARDQDRTRVARVIQSGVERASERVVDQAHVDHISALVGRVDETLREICGRAEVLRVEHLHGQDHREVVDARDREVVVRVRGDDARHVDAVVVIGRGVGVLVDEIEARQRPSQ